MQNLLDQTAQGVGAVSGSTVNWDRGLPLNLQGRRTVLFYLAVTVITGTLDIEIVKEVNGEEFVIDTIPQQGGVANVTHLIANCPNNVFARGTVGGTSATYRLDGEILE